MAKGRGDAMVAGVLDTSKPWVQICHHHIGVPFSAARVDVDALAEFLKHCAGYARDVGPP